MKTTIAIILGFVTSLCIAQPTLIAPVNSGGKVGLNWGAIITMAPGANTLTSSTPMEFGPMPLLQFGKLLKATNGLIYGCSEQGGAADGLIFSYDPTATRKVKQLFSFTDGINERYPLCNLLQLNSNQLMGVCRAGGLGTNNGGLFIYNISGDSLSYNLQFNNATGIMPLGSMVLASNGKVYGTCSGGGVSGWGTLFEFDPVTLVFTKKMDFNAVNGWPGETGLMEAGNGKIYGVCGDGGANGKGTLFEYNYSLNIFTKKVDFDSTNTGKWPVGSLVSVGGNKLYGVTKAGGTNNAGVLYEYDFVLNVLTNKANMSGYGITPYAEPVFASNGKLYGTTQLGGLNNKGILYEYNIAGNTLTKKVDFNDATTSGEPSSLIEHQPGVLLGRSSTGGVNTFGSIYEYNYLNNQLVRKFDFVSACSPQSPASSLVQLSNGKLYGSSVNGGIYVPGTLFEFVKDSLIVNRKADFIGINGKQPFGTPMQASNGKLYGFLQKNAVCVGVKVYEHDPATGNTSTNLTFAGTPWGAEAYGKLTQAPNGKLYGFTFDGGSQSVGAIIVYDYSVGSTTVVGALDGANLGQSPYGSLILEPNGKMYAVTSGGGANGLGTIIEFDPATNVVTKKLDFNSTIGSTPIGDFVKATNGKFYGTCSAGGANNMGTIYEYNISTNSLTKLYDFNSNTGATPKGPMIQSVNGKLYGLTTNGGANNLGVAFEFDIYTNTYIAKLNFDGKNGASPLYNGFIEVCTKPVNPNSISGSSVICTGTTSATYSLPIINNATSYNWILPAGATFISGQNTNSPTINFSTLVSGTYTLKCSGQNICGSGTQSSYVVTVAACSGIEEFDANTNFKIYPNPANDNINITADKEINKIEIFNSYGQKVLSHSGINKDNVSLNLKELAAGIYFVQLHVAEGTVTKKIIKE